MLQRLTILFVYSLLLNISFAQQSVYTEAAKPVAKTKFYLPQEGVVIFNLLLDDFSDTLNFIFDTGASTTFLDSAFARKLNLTVSDDVKIARGMGGTQQILLTKNHTIRINQLKEDNVDMYLMNIEILSYLYGKTIHGIIGYPLLKKYTAKVNYDKEELSFWTFGKIKYPARGFTIRPNISTFSYYVTHVEDQKTALFNYMFDTGAALTVLFSTDYLKDNEFIHPKRQKFKKRMQGLGGNVDFDISLMKKIKFGKYSFRNVPINIFEDENNITSYPSNGGLLGNEILRRFNCILDYNARQFHFTPNKHFKDAFDYAYSGLELYLIEDKIIVGDVSENSPAEAAGIRHGDEIIAINRQFAFDTNKAKKELQSTTGKVNVILKREEELQTVQMKTIDIRKKK